ncbi:hypothetical protein [Nocardia jiangxiensis]|uniref:Uncharacterized protein n=1 Tax=Nocardia jiangxiensis TaxID=282685 RepID=A0ABW6RW63_9NOCA|nr:hypothetical protein [Nocardia jiangxiensis]
MTYTDRQRYSFAIFAMVAASLAMPTSGTAVSTVLRTQHVHRSASIAVPGIRGR